MRARRSSTFFGVSAAAVERRAVGSVQREQAVRPRPARLRLRGAVHIGSRAHIRVDDGCDGEIVREQLRQMRIAPRQALLRARTQRTGEKFRHARPAVRQRQHRRRGGVGVEQQGRIGGAIGHGGGSFRGEFCQHTVLARRRSGGEGSGVEKQKGGGERRGARRPGAHTPHGRRGARSGGVRTAQSAPSRLRQEGRERCAAEQETGCARPDAVRQAGNK